MSLSLRSRVPDISAVLFVIAGVLWFVTAVIVFLSPRTDTTVNLFANLAGALALPVFVLMLTAARSLVRRWRAAFPLTCVTSVIAMTAASIFSSNLLGTALSKMLGFITSGLCIVIFVAVVLHKTGQDDVNASSPEDTPSSSAASESYRNPFST